MLSWNELKSRCNACTDCELCRTRRNVVFGVGNKNADIMFIGEGPGEQEDLQGVPFVGAAGKLLDDIMSIIDLDIDRGDIDELIVKLYEDFKI